MYKNYILIKNEIAKFEFFHLKKINYEIVENCGFCALISTPFQPPPSIISTMSTAPVVEQLLAKRLENTKKQEKLAEEARKLESQTDQAIKDTLLQLEQLQLMRTGLGGPVVDAAIRATAAAVRDSPWAPLAALHPGIAAAAAAPITAAPITAAAVAVAPITAAAATGSVNLGNDFQQLIKLYTQSMLDVSITEDNCNYVIAVVFKNINRTEFFKTARLFGLSGWKFDKSNKDRATLTVDQHSRATFKKNHCLLDAVGTLEQFDRAFVVMAMVNTEWTFRTKKHFLYLTPEFIQRGGIKLTEQMRRDYGDNTHVDLMSNMGIMNSRIHFTDSRSSGGGGGGASAAVDIRGRSVKQSRADVTGPSFQPTGKLADLIEKHGRVVPGANNAPVSIRLQVEMKTYGLVRYSDGLVAADPGSKLNSDEIEKILCDVFDMQTAAKIAAKANQTAKPQTAYKAQELAARSAGIGQIPPGGDDDSDNDDADNANSGDENPGLVTGADVRLVTDGDEHCPNVVETIMTDSHEIVVKRALPNKIVDLLKVVDDDAVAIIAKVATKWEMIIENETYCFINGSEITQEVTNAMCEEIATAAMAAVAAYFK